jgi:hypothetical protein
VILTRPAHIPSRAPRCPHGHRILPSVFLLYSQKKRTRDPGVLIDSQRELCHEFVMKKTPLRRFAREEERSLRGSNPQPPP